VLLDGWHYLPGDPELRKAMLLRGLVVPPIPEVDAVSTEPSLP
jgi:hypothetical protein